MEKCKIWVLPKSKVSIPAVDRKKKQFGGVFNEGVRGIRRRVVNIGLASLRMFAANFDISELPVFLFLNIS